MGLSETRFSITRDEQTLTIDVSGEGALYESDMVPEFRGLTGNELRTMFFKDTLLMAMKAVARDPSLLSDVVVVAPREERKGESSS